MSTFVNNGITNSGKLLLAKSYLGEKIHFTKIVMGDGYLPPNTPICDMTTVVNPIVDIPITKMKMNADGTVIIGGKFSNSDITSEFFYRELALFATGDDGAEILYCYGNAGDFSERITPVGGSSIIEKVIDIVTVIGTTKNVTATIVQMTTASEVDFDDSITNIGATNIQEAIEILAGNLGNSVSQIPYKIISDTEPTEPCEIWLKPMGSTSINTALGGDSNVQTINILGAHLGNEPPEDTRKIWFKPIG